MYTRMNEPGRSVSVLSHISVSKTCHISKIISCHRLPASSSPCRRSSPSWRSKAPSLCSACRSDLDHAVTMTTMYSKYKAWYRYEKIWKDMKRYEKDWKGFDDWRTTTVHHEEVRQNALKKWECYGNTWEYLQNDNVRCQIPKALPHCLRDFLSCSLAALSSCCTSSTKRVLTSFRIAKMCKTQNWNKHKAYKALTKMLQNGAKRCKMVQHGAKCMCFWKRPRRKIQCLWVHWAFLCITLHCYDCICLRWAAIKSWIAALLLCILALPGQHAHPLTGQQEMRMHECTYE